MGALEKDEIATALINQPGRRPIIAIVHEPHPRSERSTATCVRAPVCTCAMGAERTLFDPRIRIRYFVTDAGP